MKKLSAKGTIDVLNRNATNSTVTPVLQNLNGIIVDAGLTGKAAHLFNSEFEAGKVIITAKEDANLITKYAYELKLVLTVKNALGETEEITSEAFKLKTKQGKAKITAVPKSGTFYSATYNTIKLDFDATLSGAKNPVIEKIELINFTEMFDYNAEMGELTLKNNGEAVKGKKYNLQFQITLDGQADNEKAVILKYSVSVK